MAEDDPVKHAAGSPTIDYFEKSAPGVPRFEQNSGNNAAEWIVNITTRV